MTRAPLRPTIATVSMVVLGLCDTSQDGDPACRRTTRGFDAMALCRPAARRCNADTETGTSYPFMRACCGSGTRSGSDRLQKMAALDLLWKLVPFVLCVYVAHSREGRSCGALSIASCRLSHASASEEPYHGHPCNQDNANTKLQMTSIAIKTLGPYNRGVPGACNVMEADECHLCDCLRAASMSCA